MNAFSKLGHKIFVIIIRSEHKTPQISYFKENELDVIEIHPPSFMKLKGTRGIGRYLNYLACFPTISRITNDLVKKYEIDYIYSYMPGIGSSLPAMRVKSKHKIKFILDFADLHVFVRPKKIADMSFEKADKIIVITEYLKNELQKKKIDVRKIHIIPNGVDLELFNSKKYGQEEIIQMRNSFGSDNVLVFCGSLQDLNMIIDSAGEVIKKIKDVKYVIVGDHRDPNRSKIAWENKVKSIGLLENFVFVGRKPRDEIPKYILSADICLDSFPDEPYYAAAHPIKLLEYGACGKPVVATRVSETEKLVKDGQFGYLVEPGNSLEYANRIVELLNSKEKRENMGKDFENYIRENFGWNKISLDLQKALKN
jgi:glycosyltransferase involved in cell wall biosynthesis